MNLENKKQIAIIALAVGLGLVAAILTGNHIQSSIRQETAILAKQAQKNDEMRRQEIALLKKELEALATRQVQLAQRATQQVATPSGPPEPPKSSLALRTPPGKRALTLRIDSLSAVGGLINPGDYVDIMGHLNIPDTVTGGQSENITAIIFQNVQILAVGANLQATGGYAAQQAAGALNVTVAVSPEEAGLMVFAARNGTFRFVLRSPSETEVQMLETATWDGLGEYVLENFGMELVVPRERTVLQPVGSGMSPGRPEEVQPYIQIFRGGREN